MAEKTRANAGDRSAEEAQNTTIDPEPTPEQVAPQETDSGKMRRFWLKYIGPAGTSLGDPYTGRTWQAGEELEVTEEEGDRLLTNFPNEVDVRSTYQD